VYPTFFRIGTFEITSFGVLVAIGALVGLWIFGRELARSGLPEDATNAAVAGVIGGLVGAKLLWTFEHHGEDQLLSLLLSRGGMSWFGGFLGGVGAGLAAMRIQRLPIVRVLAAAAPALAIGQAIGRIGCFLVGDDYGRPTDLPWGVAFPKGLPPTNIPVHPTQLYECAALIVLFVFLMRWRRAGVPDAQMIGRYLALAGVIRFAIEFLRVNVRVLGPFTVAGLASIGITIVGVLILLRAPAAAAPVRRSRTAS
jgi:phosphatidylglycerol:prolipoprotein diacylglycerol transferase